jgi:segregation and condensation protein A
MYKVKVEKFEGPLDLLLELIEDQKLDITEISLANITDKYLNQVAHLDPKNYDVADFMLVAARLIYLKSKALLPSLESAEEEAEIEDLKSKLEIYKKYKEAAREFSNILSKNQRSFSPRKPQLSLRSFTPPKGVDMKDLWFVFNKMIKDMPQEMNREEIALPSEKITVEEKLVQLHENFRKQQKHSFSKLISGSSSKIEAIVTFLAILEMVKCKKLRFKQTANFKDIDLIWVKK